MRQGYLDLDVERTTRSAALALVHERTPAVLLANVINSILIAWIVADDVAVPLLAAWTGAMVLQCIVRGGLWLRFRDKDMAGWSRRWSRISIIGSTVAGALWGVAGIILYVPASPVHVAALVFVLGGMAAGALTTLSAHLPSLASYLVLSVAPFAFRLIGEGGQAHLIMAAMGFLFLASLLVIGRYTHESLMQSLRLRYENRRLVQGLEQRVADRTRRQAMVVEFSQRALSGLETVDLLKQATSLIAAGLDADYAVATEWLPQSGSVVIRAVAGREDHHLANSVYAVDSASPAGRSLRTGEPSVCADLRSKPFFVSAPQRAYGVIGTISVPVWSAQSTFGLLEAWFTRPLEHPPDDVDFVRSIATTVAEAMQRRSAEDRVQRIALHDPLTGLPNRTLFRENLTRAVTHVQRSQDLVALLLIDLDHFKDVNDSLGHSAGDQLLTEVGQRLRASMRREDPPTRLGGDEFALILSGLRRPDDAAAVAEKVLKMLTEPFFIGGNQLHVGASIGITVCPTDGSSPDDLLRNADLALYRAKAQGRCGYQFYSADMTQEVENRISLIRELRNAIDGDQLHLAYQPQVALADGRITGFEALLRWRNPLRGMVLPERFIPLAESSGLIAAVGDWTIHQACLQARQWFDDSASSYTVAINVSLAQWRRHDAMSAIEVAWQSNACDPRMLELEITEREFPLTDETDLLRSLNRLRQQGVSIAIDDFGTGHSNLVRLRRLPVDRIKIDRSFVSGLGHDIDAEMIVRAIIRLGQNLGIDVVAEGVEHHNQADFLRSEGCQYAQGYYYGRPMQAEAVRQFLRDKESAAQLAEL